MPPKFSALVVVNVISEISIVWVEVPAM